MNLIFDSSKLQKHEEFPVEFLWPKSDLVHSSLPEELNEPLVDLGGFIRGDEKATCAAADLVRKACLSHGFFQVINHGVDAALIDAAYEEIDTIFKLPIEKKLTIRRKPGGGVSGYSGAHADRFSSKLPWKETFSFAYRHHHDHDTDLVVVDYFRSTLGQDFQRTGYVSS